jgi:hypothetical protein
MSLSINVRVRESKTGLTDTQKKTRLHKTVVIRIAASSNYDDESLS